jgi:hypothetical protein
VKRIAVLTSAVSLSGHPEPIWLHSAHGRLAKTDLEHPLTAAMRMLDLAVPVLTGDPTSKAMDLVKASGESETIEKELLPNETSEHECNLSKAIRESQIISIILWREVGNQLELVTRNPAEIALLAEMIAAVCRASINCI